MDAIASVGDRPVRQPARFWTSQELRALAELRRQGVKMAAIARRLGRTKEAVEAAVSRYRREIGGTRRMSRPEDETILKLHHRGLTGAEIARRLGCAQETVCRRLNRLGLRPNGPQGDDFSRRMHRAALERIEEYGDPISAARQAEAAAMGWPEARTGLQAAICQVLYDCGPTRLRDVRDKIARPGVTAACCMMVLWGLIERVSRGVYDLPARLRARKDEEAHPDGQ